METNSLKLRERQGRPPAWVCAVILVWCSCTALAEPIDARIVASDPQGLTLELNLPPPEVEPVSGTGATWHQVIVLGASVKQTLGQPELPQHGVLIGIPNEAQLTLTVLDARADGEIRDVRVAPSILRVDEDVLLPWQRIEQTLDAAIYNQDAWFPSSLASVGFQGRLRGQAVAQILFHPVTYNPILQTVRAYRTLRVRVDFDRPLIEPAPTAAVTSTRTGSGPPPGDPFEPILRNTLLNHTQLGR